MLGGGYFFFFKQKTAYEMRISDWSSDVCSSDLTVLWDPSAKATAPATIEVRLPTATPAHNVAQDMDLVIAFEDEHLIVVDKPAGMVVHPAAGNLDGPMGNALLHHCRGQLLIGRGSWRERGCQSGETWVVAGTKKK